MEVTSVLGVYGWRCWEPVSPLRLADVGDSADGVVLELVVSGTTMIKDDRVFWDVESPLAPAVAAGAWEELRGPLEGVVEWVPVRLPDGRTAALMEPVHQVSVSEESLWYPAPGGRRYYLVTFDAGTVADMSMVFALEGEDVRRPFFTQAFVDLCDERDIGFRDSLVPIWTPSGGAVPGLGARGALSQAVWFGEDDDEIVSYSERLLTDDEWAEMRDELARAHDRYGVHSHPDATLAVVADEAGALPDVQQLASLDAIMDVIECQNELAALFGDALVSLLGWEWIGVLGSDGVEAMVVAPKDRSVFVWHLDAVRDARGTGLPEFLALIEVCRHVKEAVPGAVPYALVPLGWPEDD